MLSTGIQLSSTKDTHYSIYVWFNCDDFKISLVNDANFMQMTKTKNIITRTLADKPKNMIYL